MKKKFNFVAGKPKEVLPDINTPKIKVVKHYKFSDDNLDHISYVINRIETSQGSRDNWNITVTKQELDILRKTLNDYIENEPRHPKEQ